MTCRAVPGRSKRRGRGRSGESPRKSSLLYHFYKNLDLIEPDHFQRRPTRVELAFADAMQQLNAGDRHGRAIEDRRLSGLLDRRRDRDRSTYPCLSRRFRRRATNDRLCRTNRFQRFSNSGAKRCTQRMIVVWAKVRPRSAIISTRSRKLQLVAQVPANAQHDDLPLEVPALEWFVHALQPLRHRSAFSSKPTAYRSRDLHQSL